MLLRKNTVNTSAINRNLIQNTRYKAPYVRPFLIYAPNALNIAVIENGKYKWLYMYNSNYNFILPLASSYCSVYINYNKDIISIVPSVSNSFYSTFTSYYNTILHTFYKPTFKKLKFRGKGYYIYKNTRNTIAPQFGYSHRLYVYSYFNHVKFIGKTKIILFGLVKEDVIAASLTLKLKRNINIFTGRGVRFARQVVYKKQGKVSSYR